MTIYNVEALNVLWEVFLAVTGKQYKPKTTASSILLYSREHDLVFKLGRDALN